MQLRTDPGPIARRLRLPSAVVAVRWAAKPSDDGLISVPGPTDMIPLYVVAELDLSRSGPVGLGHPASVTWPAEIAQVVLPSEIAAHRSGNTVLVQGDAVDLGQLSGTASVSEAVIAGRFLVMTVQVRD